VSSKLLKVTCVIILLFASKVYAQKNTLSITATIIDEKGHGVSNCYFKLSRKQNNQILAYFVTGKDSIVHYNISLPTNDSFFITLSHISYKTWVQGFWPSQLKDSLTITAALKIKTGTLDDVIVTAPPVWVRGDTTFFKANAFKQGDERRLKDLILKMPGFEIDDNGTLLYKKKPIEKVMIDGEEIFADKIKLLINNFPIQAVDVVQALENQNNNPLFKGLKNENRVFLNLSLTKAKLKAAFGNAEIGIGTEGRYYVNPVLFTLYGKLKAGYIGNLNSIGDGMGWREQMEQKPVPTIQPTQWMMNSNSLQLLGNFDENRFITNNRSTHNLQVNLPIDKKLKQKLELGFIKDKQLQNTNYQSFIYNDTGYLSRGDTNYLMYNPNTFLAKHTLEYKRNSTEMLTTNMLFYNDATSCTKNSIYQFASNQSVVSNYITNNWATASGSIEFVKRQNANKAIKLSAFYNYHNYPQQGSSISNDWATIFSLNNNYKTLQQTLVNKSQEANLVFEQTKKVKNVLHVWEVNGKLQHININNKTSFVANTVTPKDTLLNALSGFGNYTIASVNTSLQQTLKIFKLPINARENVGFFSSTIKEQARNKFVYYPTYNIELTNKFTIKKFLKNTVSFNIEQTNVDAKQQSQIILPATINNFYAYANNEQPFLNLKASYSLAYWWPRKFNSSYITLDYTNRFRNSVFGNNVNGILQLSIDSFINKPTNSFSVNTTTSINKVKTGDIYTIGGGLDWSEAYFSSSNLLLKNNQFFIYLNASAQHNWRKKYFLKVSTLCTYVAVKTPSIIKASAIDDVVNTRFLVKQRVAITKQVNFVLNTEWYTNNLTSKNATSFFFADAEINWGIPSKHLFFFLRAENLTNQKFYYTSNTTFNVQSLYQVPLVKTNFMATVKYEL
jgi:hypothetical protein